MSSRRRWRPKKKRRHEDVEVSFWQAGGSGDAKQSNQVTGKQLKKDKTSVDNLGCRHRALNTKVNDAFAGQTDFDSAKCSLEKTEVDRLFKIDLAAKIKNVDYLVDMLKSGDSLYTARTLKKAEWLFDDEYSHIIHPEYLYENIFPVISMRMKRKIIKAAARNVSNPDRAAQFYHCCIKEKMTNTACTCLIYTSEAFKLDVLQKRPVSELEKKDIVFIRFLVGNSFVILDAFLNYLTSNWKINSTARQFKNLYYTVSNERYLDIVEKYVSISEAFKTIKFDLKLSDSIMTNHKDRVLTKPEFYVHTVNTEVLVKYSTIDDAKIYATALLPDTGREFWSRRYDTTYSPVFDIIPKEQIYDLFKSFFLKHYPKKEFEMHPGFYKQKYYTFMTNEERHQWALRHLNSQNQILGVGNDFVWYRFVKFELSFPKIKELINITKNAKVRNLMIRVLIESAQNHRDLESLFIYYHKRHLNELRTHKENFLHAVILERNVFEFDEVCWAAFYEILLTMNLYNTCDAIEKQDDEDANDTFKTVTLLYHILNDKPFSEELMKYFLDYFNVYNIDDHLHHVDNQQKLHDFFFDIYMEHIFSFKHQPHSKEVTERVNRYFENIKSSMAILNKECNVKKQRQNDNYRKTRNVDNTLSDRQLLRDLKKDKRLVVSKVLDVKKKCENSLFRFNQFLNKIKIYFSEDITRIYLDMFDSLVYGNTNLQPVKAGVHGIFYLGDYKAKMELINKFAPVSSKKIDKKIIGVNHLQTQKAICRYACVSRPHLPLASIAMYMKGSYAKYSLHVFNTYLASLPLPICLEFVHSVIDAPISIQKHAIRLAFQCFDEGSLIRVIKEIWKTTKNVSIRRIIYKALYNKVVDTNKQIFSDGLLKLTSSLHENDENEIFDVVVSNKVSESILGDYIEAAWEAISSFEDKQPNIKRKEGVICCIQDQLYLLRKSFVFSVIQKHVDMMVKENNLMMTYAKTNMSQLYKEKWRLIARFIMHYTRSDFPHEEYVQMAEEIVRNSVVKWDDVIEDNFVHQMFLWDFSCYLQEASFKYNIKYFEDGLPIFDYVLTLIKSLLPIHDTYKLVWELELAVISRKSVKNNKNSFRDDEYDAILKTTESFSRDLSKLVSLYVYNRTFMMLFSSNIKDMVQKHARNIVNVIAFNFNDEHECSDDEYMDDVFVMIASTLVKFNLPETFVLAVQILPLDSEEDNFMYVINKLKKCSHPEVRLALHQKFRKFCDNSNLVNNTYYYYRNKCIML